MKYFSLLPLLILPLMLPAQGQRKSLLAQIPYIPEEDPGPALLNPEDALKALEPLPDFQIPNRLPNEFFISSEGWKLLEITQKANEFYQQGQTEKASEIIREALEMYPKEVSLRVKLADSLYAMGKHREAVVEYEKSLEIAPLYFQALNNLAWLYATTADEELRNLEKAEVLAERAKVVEPTSHHLWSTLSQIYFQQRKYAEAENAIQNALRIVQRLQVDTEMVMGYVVQRERCALARQATSIWE